MSVEPELRLAAARRQAVRIAPYFAGALLQARYRCAPRLGTLAITRRAVIAWDPVVVERWSVAELATVLIHEVSHVLRAHYDRAHVLGADPATWNMAADCEINDDLGLPPFGLPPSAVTPAGLGLAPGGLAETYYRALDAGRSPVDPARTGAASSSAAEAGTEGGGDPSAGPGDGSSGSSSPADEPSGPAGAGGAAGRSPVDPTRTGTGPDCPDGEPGVCRGHCGSGAGHAVDGEPDDDAEGLTAAELRELRREVSSAICAHARGRGSVPSSLARWAEGELAASRLPWPRLLARELRASCGWRPGALATTYTRPSRRQAGIGWGPGRPIMAAWRTPVPRVVVVIDTSFSMSALDLAEALGEIRGVLRALSAEVTVIVSDSAVHAVRRVRALTDLRQHLAGGGGTDFCPAIEAARRAHAEVIIYLTDGDGTCPAAPPAGVRMIWALVGAHRRRPPWGQSVEVAPSTIDGGGSR